MSTTFIITGPAYATWFTSLKTSGFEVIPVYDDFNNVATARIRCDGRDVGRLQRVPFSDYGWQLEISTGWCKFGLLQTVLERIECEVGL